MSAEHTFDVFFYGLFMDAGLLSARGVVPRDPRPAFVADHVVRLGAKAMLLRSPGARAGGMLFRLTHREMDKLYAGDWEYRPVPLLAVPAGTNANGGATAALCMVHRDPPLHSARNPPYAVQWESLVQRLGLDSPEHGVCP
jgi:hypothetical protein